ncbi:MAG: DUF255 domain-containing protein [Campylobacterota bacterium]|nr:DUF255 domain-containing protein [Campylobacterota bacterium]
MFKKITLITTLMSSLLYAELDWVSFSDAFEKSKSENRPIMVMISREGCDACEYMEYLVFDNYDIEEKLNGDFIPVHLDIEKDASTLNAHNLPSFARPTFYFLRSDGSKIVYPSMNDFKGKRVVGAQNIKDFTITINSVEDAYKNGNSN